MSHLSKQKLLSGRIAPVQVAEQRQPQPDPAHATFQWVIHNYINSLATTPRTISDTYFVIDSIG